MRWVQDALSDDERSVSESDFEIQRTRRHPTVAERFKLHIAKDMLCKEVATE